MFTGLIQSIGTIKKNNLGVLVDGCNPFSPLKLGDSVSVDGVCLTVSELINDSFVANISEETLKRTNLGEKAQRNGYVNLEPALRLSDRLGGHIVSGHIDGVGEVVLIENLKNSWNLKVSWNDSNFCKYMCDKASISLNGISLTIAEIYDDGCKFSIAVIPHTWSNTCLKFLKIGEKVNLEVDLMAKYAEKLLKLNKSNNDFISKENSEISSKWLKEQGWN
ncbi:riboflavin synthase [Prochlorococcus marinus]|uniref:Riboflavin synthase n=1 Tax=Prochlorococcus marinus XMU1408 TaxID=2213228 RepID=A0A318R2Y2_PROMR|nr:riboflavin synthase [Prochlorococcus marinus]MBW3041466.1 riboflavin synthase [Prochlorococcus marinus str. XMU1408]PYE02624.1 riboflavin synthase [Prochlorococcus marinus XMU1408]